jgi:hypothetical protein
MPFAFIHFFDAFSPGSPPPRPTPGPMPPGPVDPGWGVTPPVDPGYGRPDWAWGHPSHPLPPSPGHPWFPFVPGSGYPSTGPVRPPWSGNYPSQGLPVYPSTGPVYPGGPVDPGWGGGWGSGNYPTWGPVRPGGPVDPGYGRPDLPPYGGGYPTWGPVPPQGVDPGYGRPEIPGWSPVDPGWGTRPPVDPGYGRPEGESPRLSAAAITGPSGWWVPRTGYPSHGLPWAPAYPAPPIYFQVPTDPSSHHRLRSIDLSAGACSAIHRGADPATGARQADSATDDQAGAASREQADTSGSRRTS